MGYVSASGPPLSRRMPVVAARVQSPSTAAEPATTSLPGFHAMRDWAAPAAELPHSAIENVEESCCANSSAHTLLVNMGGNHHLRAWAYQPNIVSMERKHFTCARVLNAFIVIPLLPRIWSILLK